MLGKKSQASSKGTKIDTLIGQNSELTGDIVYPLIYTFFFSI